MTQRTISRDAPEYNAQPLSKVRSQIRSMDLIARRVPNDLISRGTGTDIVHVGKAHWDYPVFEPVDFNSHGDLDPSLAFLTGAGRYGELMIVETRFLTGCRSVSLKSQVEKYPGQLEVYEVNPDCRWREYDRRAAARFMLQETGNGYGLLAMLMAGLMRLTFGWLVRPDTNSARRRSWLRDCSWFVDDADQIGGVHPVNGKAPWQVTPGELVQSPFYRYRFTLAGV